MRRWLLFPGKAFTEPLFVLLALAFFLFALARRKRRAYPFALASLLLIWICSAEATAKWMARMIAIPADPGEPEVIAILSGGSYRGFDLLNPPTTSRVVAGARWAQEHPNARVVMSGIDVTATGTSTRTLELMRDLAVQLGVDARRISLETRSTRTLEHPYGLLRLPGITPQTRIGVVTNDWHMRRARLAFRKRFATVICHPAAPEPGELLVNDLLPTGDGARDTTIMIHECIGLAWYALKR